MNNLLIIPGVALIRAIAGWGENALEDGKIDLPEWKRLGSTIVRMGVPMAALIWGLKIDAGVSAGMIVVLDIVLTKVYSALKKKKK